MPKKYETLLASRFVLPSKLNTLNTMRSLYHLRGWLLLLAILLLSSSVEAKKGKTIKVLQFNIWQEGTVIPNGYEAIATIKASFPDYASMIIQKSTSKTIKEALA